MAILRPLVKVLRTRLTWPSSTDSASNGLPLASLHVLEATLQLSLALPDLLVLHLLQLPAQDLTGQALGDRSDELDLPHALVAGHLAAQENALPYFLGVLPFFLILAALLFHATVFKGLALVVLPRFEPETFLGAIQKFRLKKVTLAQLFLAKHPIVDKFDLSSVKVVSSGGAAMGKEVERAVEKRIRGARVIQGYGMTEFAGGMSNGNLAHSRAGSTGREQDRRVLFRTPSMMKGYYNDPEANRATFTDDGFIRTGDVGYIDQDGHVFIVDRLKEFIKYKGHQVAPAELEDVLSHHPSVADSCCVRGFDSATGEEIPKAFVVLKAEETPLSEEDLTAFVASSADVASIAYPAGRSARELQRDDIHGVHRRQRQRQVQRHQVPVQC
ncbi:hypothetical protein PHYPSEUDO_005627 [Phytophthora pseudosyringae]|uniref:4-coumarate-CoA ligase n=1 Tax=Phytophthora pseudosyringae TaxID=221518 RepID=A0A8T1VR08_9STRA|nr:hypothetical protein PHYPSEUDO_005627 [Phytophthora pseudosyringae]